MHRPCTTAAILAGVQPTRPAFPVARATRVPCPLRLLAAARQSARVAVAPPPPAARRRLAPCSAAAPRLRCSRSGNTTENTSRDRHLATGSGLRAARPGAPRGARVCRGPSGRRSHRPWPRLAARRRSPLPDCVPGNSGCRGLRLCRRGGRQSQGAAWLPQQRRSPIGEIAAKLWRPCSYRFACWWRRTAPEASRRHRRA